MSRFNILLILVVTTLFFACIRVAVAETCTPSNSLQDLSKVSSFLKHTEVHPWYSYQYNGKSVTKEEYDAILQRGHDKSHDPQELLP